MLSEIIAGEIRKNDPISFARFMELALYCPDCGYYEREKDNPGRRGDFFTNVSVGALFGELLASQFARWLKALPAVDAGWSIVEAGAHDGRLAKDILFFLQEQQPEIFERIGYILIEPSLLRKRWQMQTLGGFENRVRWMSQPGKAGSHGIIFSNELLDAMPVHRVGWSATESRWFEWGVTLEKGRFAWARMRPEASEGIHPLVPSELLEKLPDGFTTEIRSAASRWWRQGAEMLAAGKLLTIDYGLEAEDFFAPHRCDGTLRAYYRHQVTPDVLANAGDQDLTAHVNFSELIAVGESAGLKTDMLVSQEKFLTAIAKETANVPDSFGGWTSSRTRQFQTLTHPDHLGRRFHVLVQSR